MTSSMDWSSISHLSSDVLLSALKEYAQQLQQRGIHFVPNTLKTANESKQLEENQQNMDTENTIASTSSTSTSAASSSSSVSSITSSAKPENANEECVGPTSESAGVASSCSGCPNQSFCASGGGRAAAAQAAEAANDIQSRLAGVRHKILVLSGKGGVGKSTMTVALARRLASLGLSVGVLDIDICGPSMARMFGVEGEEVKKSNFGWSPVYSEDNIAVMSVALMLQSRDDAVIWRGPRKSALIRQFLTDVYWGDDLDCLLIDAPPGTSDEHLSITSLLKECDLDGAFIVTTAQEMSLMDVRKEINFCHKVGVPVLGVIENMSAFICPHCNNSSIIFPQSTGGAAAMCEAMKMKFLGSVPIDPQLLKACEDGENYWTKYPKATARTHLDSVWRAAIQQNNQLAKDERLTDALLNAANEMKA